MMKRREKNLLLILHAEESAVVGVGGTKLLWVTDDLSQKKEWHRHHRKNAKLFYDTIFQRNEPRQPGDDENGLQTISGECVIIKECTQYDQLVKCLLFGKLKHVQSQASSRWEYEQRRRNMN